MIVEEKMKAGFKDSPLGQIPESWEVKTLSQISGFRRGSFPQPYGLDEWYDDENGFPFIQVFDVGDDFKLKNETKRKISELAAEQSVFVPKGTLILTIQGSIGRMAITHYDAYIDRTLLIFQSFQNPTSLKFFMYVVYVLFEGEKQKAHGSTIKTITKEQLSQFKILLPPLPEQQKIAEILSSVDDKIGVIDEQIVATQQLKKGLMQRLLTKGIGHTRFKDSPLGQIPESWEIVKLEDLFEGLTDYTANGSFASLKENVQVTDEVDYAKWIMAKTLKSGNFDSSVRYTNKKGYDFLTKTSLHGGELLMPKTGYLGEAYIFPDLGIKATLADNVFLITPNKRTTRQFLLQFFKSPIFKRLLKASSYGTSQITIVKKELRAIKIALPSVQEQSRIEEILVSVDSKLIALKEKKTHYQTLKKGLMQQLLTGKVRVKV